jgi:CBS domain containing-hemolysin-like protein
MITMEDIIEELTGDIESEFDRLPGYIHACGTSSWIMGGGVLMTTAAVTLGLNWQDKFSLPGKELKIPTLSEWCRHKTHNKILGAEPIESDGIRVVPRKFRRKKVFEAAVSLSTIESVKANPPS